MPPSVPDPQPSDAADAGPTGAPVRRIGAPQMAFVRCWAEGLDLAQAWHHYLWADGGADARSARGTLQRLLDELGALARVHGRPDVAVLLRRDPDAMAHHRPVRSRHRGADADAAPASEPAPPPTPSTASSPSTLDEFRALQPPDFYGEAELIALFEQQSRAASPAQPAGTTPGPGAAAGTPTLADPAHAPAGDGPAASTLTAHRAAARRRQRLRERLLQALAWLEHLAVREPVPGDAVSAWFDERVAARLQHAGVERLEQLAGLMTQRGFHWYRAVPRMGPAGAARIVRWWQSHAPALGALPARVTTAPRALAAVAAVQTLPPAGGDRIAPIERFVPPAGLDGSGGANRADRARCRIAARNDHEAVQAWLRLRVPGSHTWRAYRKEAERFLLWSVLERHKPLSSLDGDDCVAWRDFLAAPPAAWTGPRHVPRWSEAWRPFEGPLAPRSAAASITVVRTLCEWLVRRRYLDSNPWDDVPLRPDAPSRPQLRALSQRQWSLLQRWLADEPPCHARHRLRFVLDLAYSTGLRLSELCAARVHWLREEMLDDERPGWTLQVLGKRQRWREVPLPHAAVESFREYLHHRGLPTDPTANDPETPLIARLSDPGPLSPARLYEVLADAFARCASAVRHADPRAAQRIEQASTHWLRHTHGSHAVARGVPPDVLQATLGHRSLATTSIYVNAELTRRHRALEAAFGRAAVDGVSANRAAGPGRPAVAAGTAPLASGEDASG